MLTDRQTDRQRDRRTGMKHRPRLSAGNLHHLREFIIFTLRFTGNCGGSIALREREKRERERERERERGREGGSKVRE